MCWSGWTTTADRTNRPWWSPAPHAESQIRGKACYHHLVTLDAQFLGRRDIQSIAPLVAGTTCPQHGMFVFYRANGEKVLVGRLPGMANPAAEYHVSVL